MKVIIVMALLFLLTNKVYAQTDSTAVDSTVTDSYPIVGSVPDSYLSTHAFINNSANKDLRFTLNQDGEITNVTMAPSESKDVFVVDEIIFTMGSGRARVVYKIKPRNFYKLFYNSRKRIYDLKRL